MSDNVLTAEETALLKKLLAKAEGAQEKPAPKKGEYGEDVQIVRATDIQDSIADRGTELKGKSVHISCRVKGPMGGNRKACGGNQAHIIRSSNKSMNFGSGELAGGGRNTTYRCLTCNGTYSIST